MTTEPMTDAKAQRAAIFGIGAVTGFFVSAFIFLISSDLSSRRTVTWRDTFGYTHIVSVPEDVVLVKIETSNINGIRTTASLPIVGR